MTNRTAVMLYGSLYIYIGIKRKFRNSASAKLRNFPFCRYPKLGYRCLLRERISSRDAVIPPLLLSVAPTLRAERFAV